MSRAGAQRSPQNDFPVTPESPRPALALMPPAIAVASEQPLPEHAGLAEIVEHACAAAHAGGAALALEEQGAVVCRARAGDMAPPLAANLDRESGISGLCWRTGEPIRCDDAIDDPRVDGEVARRLGIRSILAVPLRREGQTVGLLEVFAAQPYAFGTEQELLLQVTTERILLHLEPTTAGAADAWQQFLSPAESPTNGADPEVATLSPPPVETAPEVTAEAEQSEVLTGQVWAGDTATKRRPLLWILVLAIVALAAIGLSLHWVLSRPEPPHRAKPAGISAVRSPDLLRRAESGDAHAQYELAMRYKSGDGVPQNDPESILWLKEAARRGSADAQFELGNAYSDGRGVPRDPVNAYACYVLASANGNSESNEMLKFLTPKVTDEQIGEIRVTVGDMYLAGRGTPADPVQAYTWFSLAASAGSHDGQRQRQLLASKLSRKQIAAAEQRASQWLARHGQQGR